MSSSKYSYSNMQQVPRYNSSIKFKFKFTNGWMIYTIKSTSSFSMIFHIYIHELMKFFSTFFSLFLFYERRRTWSGDNLTFPPNYKTTNGRFTWLSCKEMLGREYKTRCCWWQWWWWWWWTVSLGYPPPVRSFVSVTSFKSFSIGWCSFGFPYFFM